MEKSILLKNILLNENVSDILICGNRIAGICDSSDSHSIEVDGDTEVVECKGKAAFPGLMNMHTHAGMALMRGIGEDIAFHEWLDRIWQVEKNIDEEYVYHATKLACLEMVKTGTTTFNDQYWYMPAAYKAALELEEAGIKTENGAGILSRIISRIPLKKLPFGFGDVFGRMGKIDAEEIMIIAVALLLIFSGEGDKLLGIALLALLFV